MAGSHEAWHELAPATKYLPNVRDLGGIACPGGETRHHRFLRSGSPSTLTVYDLEALKDWGVRHVLDLRGFAESPAQTSRLAHQPWVRWKNVELFDVDVTARLETGTYEGDNYLVSSYLSMLSSSAPIRRTFSFFAEVPKDECVLFHCAAGMDRTGMVSMLLLGLAGASRHDIVSDYCRSFATTPVVERALSSVEGGLDTLPKGTIPYLLAVRLETIACVFDRLLERFGSVSAYLTACGVDKGVQDTVTAHLLEA